MADISNSNLYDFDAGTLKKGARVVVVRTEWNAAVIDRLQEGVEEILNEYQVICDVVTVPGAFEVPFGIAAHWRTHADSTKAPDAYIALACVIRGDTPHFDYVCQSITSGVTRLNVELPVPVIFGVLTVDNDLQAQERIGGRHGHKGKEAAITAVKMIALNSAFWANER